MFNLNFDKAVEFVNANYDKPVKLFIYRITHIHPFDEMGHATLTGLIHLKHDEAHDKDLAEYLHEKKRKAFRKLFNKELDE